MIQIQMQMAERALELLSLPDDQPSFILDVGSVSHAHTHTHTHTHCAVVQVWEWTQWRGTD